MASKEGMKTHVNMKCSEILASVPKATCGLTLNTVLDAFFHVGRGDNSNNKKQFKYNAPRGTSTLLVHTARSGFTVLGWSSVVLLPHMKKWI
nr:hypothetical protein Iba_chr05cCG4090 [Ipomoea batatas]GMC99136.1 hypothetical protein Iba_chr05eCG2830 [Ipomoea batatas]